MVPPAPLLVLEGVGSGSRTHGGADHRAGLGRGTRRPAAGARPRPRRRRTSTSTCRRGRWPRRRTSPGRTPGRGPTWSSTAPGVRAAPLESGLQRCNHVIMMTNEDLERVRGWFTGRLPEEWKAAAPEVSVDREEITVIADDRRCGGRRRRVRRRARRGAGRAGERVPRGHPPPADVDRRRGPAPVRAQGVVGRAAGRRSPTRRRCSPTWPRPVMTRLRQPQRQVLDTLVDAGVARSRADALAWCVRLVGQHEDDWLASCAPPWSPSPTCGRRARRPEPPAIRL